MRLWRRCQNIGALRNGEDIDEERDEIWEMNEEISLLEKYEFLYERNGEKLRLTRNEMSRNVFKDVIYFHASCRERGGARVVACSIMWLDRLDTWIGKVLVCVTERDSRGSHRQKLYSDIYGE